MIDIQKIDYYLKLFPTLKPDDLAKLFELATMRQLAAGDVYIKEGTIPRKLAYITKGLVRVYATKENGDEVTVQLYWEDKFFASRHNVIDNKPSPFTFQAVEDTVLLDVDYAAMQQLLDNNPQFAAARNYFLLNMLSEAMERVESFTLYTPGERYLRLLEEKSNIITRVPDKYIATMLGITPVSLSRIRKRMASRAAARN